MPDRGVIDSRVSRFVAREVPRNVGTGAAWRFYDRDIRTPLNVALDLAAERLERDPVLVWVDGGAPDAFSFPGLPAPVVVLSTRHLEIASALRLLVVEDSLSAVRRELARRLTLAVVAELCLRMGKPRQAARCFLLSVQGQGFFLPHSDVLADLEMTPYSEAYAAVWCFALAHELGHHLPDAGLPSDTDIRAAAEASLRAISAVEAHPELLDPLVAELHSDQGLPDSPSHLRPEVTADLFAAETMIHVADRLMGSEGRTPRGGLLYAEIQLAHAGVSFIEWSRAVASALGQVDDERAARRRLHTTAASGVRSRYTRWYAQHALGQLMPDGLDLSRWAAALDEMVEHLSANVSVVDSGVADAMRAAVDPSVDDDRLLAEVRDEFLDGTHRVMVGVHWRAFRTLATTQGGADAPDPASDPLLQAVLDLLS